MKIPTCRLTDDWVPLPAAILAALQWCEGDIIECDVVGESLVLTRVKTPTVASKCLPKPATRGILRKRGE